MDSGGGARAWPLAGFPIREPPDRRPFAPPRGLSQLAAPFVDFRCQGIRRAPLVSCLPGGPCRPLRNSFLRVNSPVAIELICNRKKYHREYRRPIGNTCNVDSQIDRMFYSRSRCDHPKRKPTGKTLVGHFLYNSFTIRSWLRIQIEILLVKRYAAFKVPPGTPWKPDAVIRTPYGPARTGALGAFMELGSP